MCSLHATTAVVEQRDKGSPLPEVSFTKLMRASLLVGVTAAVLCAAAWWIARWLEL
jgi:hypothetical protein